jgi:hypothetical protein
MSLCVARWGTKKKSPKKYIRKKKAYIWHLLYKNEKKTDMIIRFSTYPVTNPLFAAHCDGELRRYTARRNDAPPGRLHDGDRPDSFEKFVGGGVNPLLPIT